MCVDKDLESKIQDNLRLDQECSPWALGNMGFD